jgi:hypothetical protein
LFQQLFSLLPERLGVIGLIVSGVGASLAIVLWLVGGRISRSMLTLTAVGLGTVLGMKLPLWCGWSVDGMGPAVGGAVILGVSAYAWHRFWVGASLGMLLAVWSALALWTAIAPGQSWYWPSSQLLLPQYLAELWRGLPGGLPRFLPVCAAAALAMGFGAVIWKPKIAIAVFWSFAGTSMLLGFGAALVNHSRPELLDSFPTQLLIQCAILVGMTAFGVGFQWKSLPTPKPTGAKDGKEKEVESRRKG